MTYTKYTNLKTFHQAVHNTLMTHEAQNILPLGNIRMGLQGDTRFGTPEHWLMATVTDSTGIHLAALMTPPHNMALYATDNKINQPAIQALVKGLENTPVPGVIAEKSLAEAFAEAYTTQHKSTFTIAMSQRIYQLTQVNPAIPQVGNLRPLQEQDMYFFPYWKEAFNATLDYTATTMDMPLHSQTYLDRLVSNTIYILEVEGIPVSMAGISRPMERVVGVGHVYTPPYYRGKGYASAAVAKLSQQLLDKGFEKCVLYTDLANPTSNSIYQKIGYAPIGDSLMITFDKEQ